MRNDLALEYAGTCGTYEAVIWEALDALTAVGAKLTKDSSLEERVTFYVRAEGVDTSLSYGMDSNPHIEKTWSKSDALDGLRAQVARVRAL